MIKKSQISFSFVLQEIGLKKPLQSDPCVARVIVRVMKSSDLFYFIICFFVVVVVEARIVIKRGGIMFTRIFGKPKPETNALTTLDKLNEVF